MVSLLSAAFHSFNHPFRSSGAVLGSGTKLRAEPREDFLGASGRVSGSGEFSSAHRGCGLDGDRTRQTDRHAPPVDLQPFRMLHLEVAVYFEEPHWGIIRAYRTLSNLCVFDHAGRQTWGEVNAYLRSLLRVKDRNVGSTFRWHVTSSSAGDRGPGFTSQPQRSGRDGG